MIIYLYDGSTLNCNSIEIIEFLRLNGFSPKQGGEGK